MADGEFVCGYCGETFEWDDRYVRHLYRRHDRDELDRIDRHLVESRFEAGGRFDDIWWRLEPAGRRFVEWLPPWATEPFERLWIPVSPQTILNLTILGAVMTVTVAFMLAMA